MGLDENPVPDPTNPWIDDPMAHMAEVGKFLDRTGLSKLDLAASQAIADHRNTSYIQGQVANQARQGVGPFAFVSNLIQTERAQQQAGLDFGAEQERQRQLLQQAEQDRLNLERGQPDRSNLNAAWDQYASALRRAPEAAPILQRAHIGDPEAIVGLATVLLGGLGVAPTVLQGLTMGAQGVADHQNAANQMDYQNRVNARNAETDALKMNVQKAQSDFNDQDKIMQQELNKNNRSIDLRELGIQGETRHLSAVAQATNSVLNEAFQRFPKSTDWNADADQWLRNQAFTIAKSYAKPGANPVEITTDAARLFWTLKQHANDRLGVLARSEQDTAKARADADAKAGATKEKLQRPFVFHNDLSPDFAAKNISARRNEFAISFGRQIRAFMNEVGYDLSDAEFQAYQRQAWDEANGIDPTDSPKTEPSIGNSGKPKFIPLPGKLPADGTLPPASPFRG